MNSKCLLFFLIFIQFTSYAADELTWDILTNKKAEGVIYENSGRIKKGIIDVRPCTKNVKINTGDSIIKMGMLYIKSISFYEHKNITILPLYFNDSTDTYFGQILDTTLTLKFYKGYNCSFNGAGGFYSTGGIYVGGGGGTSFIESYIVSIDGNEAVNFARSINDLSIFEIDNYKKKLLKAFGDNDKIVTYLNKFKKVRFDDIPSVVAFINSVY